MESSVDKDGKINKGKNASQYTGLTPSITGGDNGMGTKTSESMPKGEKAKLFKGRK